MSKNCPSKTSRKLECFPQNFFKFNFHINVFESKSFFSKVSNESLQTGLIGNTVFKKVFNQLNSFEAPDLICIFFNEKGF